jgi:hypothetical protein
MRVMLFPLRCRARDTDVESVDEPERSVMIRKKQKYWCFLDDLASFGNFQDTASVLCHPERSLRSEGSRAHSDARDAPSSAKLASPTNPVNRSSTGARKKKLLMFPR